MMDQETVKTAYSVIKELERIDDAIMLTDGLANNVVGKVYNSVRSIELDELIDLKATIRKGLYEKRADLTCRLTELGVKA